MQNCCYIGGLQLSPECKHRCTLGHIHPCTQLRGATPAEESDPTSPRVAEMAGLLQRAVQRGHIIASPLGGGRTASANLLLLPHFKNLVPSDAICVHARPCACGTRYLPHLHVAWHRPLPCLHLFRSLNRVVRGIPPPTPPWPASLSRASAALGRFHNLPGRR